MAESNNSDLITCQIAGIVRQTLETVGKIVGGNCWATIQNTLCLDNSHPNCDGKNIHFVFREDGSWRVKCFRNLKGESEL